MYEICFPKLRATLGGSQNVSTGNFAKLDKFEPTFLRRSLPFPPPSPNKNTIVFLRASPSSLAPPMGRSGGGGQGYITFWACELGRTE